MEASSLPAACSDSDRVSVGVDFAEGAPHG